MREDGAILMRDCDKHTYVVRLVKELATVGHLISDRQKLNKYIGDLFIKFSKYEGLFSDLSKGDPEDFTDNFLSLDSTWLDVIRAGSDEQVGVMYLTGINPGWDGEAHISFWDSHIKGREPLIWDAVEWAMERYSLHRLTAEIPVEFSTFNRIVQDNLGFVREGKRREATLQKGKWRDMHIYGMLRSDLEKAREKWDRAHGAGRYSKQEAPLSQASSAG